MTLDKLQVGEVMRLKNFEGADSVCLKLISLGVLPGDCIKVLGKAPFGGPISLQHKDDTFFALRRKEASTIFVGPIGDELE